MNQRVLNRRQVREVDRRAVDEYGFSSLVLMENAGRGVADVLCRLEPHGPVVIACGKGNNAGDGFVLARHLQIRRIAVRVLLVTDPAELTGDAQVNFDIFAQCGVPMVRIGDPPDPIHVASQFDGAVWAVDALLGTGATGEPRPPMDRIIQTLNACPAGKLAIDVPSGLDCDTGQAANATFRADHTCTFVAAKPGFFQPGADTLTGQIHVADIGVPDRLVDEVVAASRR